MYAATKAGNKTRVQQTRRSRKTREQGVLTAIRYHDGSAAFAKRRHAETVVVRRLKEMIKRVRKNNTTARRWYVEEKTKQSTKLPKVQYHDSSVVG